MALTLEDKLEICRLFETGEMTQQEIADKYGKSRQTINRVCQDETLEPLKQKILEKSQKGLVKKRAERIESLMDKTISRIEAMVDAEDDLRKIVPLFKELRNYLQLMQGKPTEIQERRNISLDINKVLELPPEKQADYLLGETIDVDYEIQTETEEKVGGADQVEVLNGVAS